MHNLSRARDGFAAYPLLASDVEYLEESYKRWPDNAKIFLPRGRAPRVGELFVQEDLGRTIGRMIQAERDARGDRDKKLRAVHDYFYRGPIADEIAAGSAAKTYAAPRGYLPGRLNLECTMPADVIEEMREVGHDVDV